MFDIVDDLLSNDVEFFIPPNSYLKFNINADRVIHYFNHDVVKLTKNKKVYIALDFGDKHSKRSNTQILTYEFKEKREYLAAKLLTIFMEYPIIFMGYSISDSNIRDILSSIVKCMSNEQVKLLKRRFIFIEYDAEMEGYEIGESSFAFEDNKLITMTKITLSDYSLIYNAIGKKKMKIPVRLLRLLKDELYLFTLSNEPTANIKVAAIDDDRVSNDELVISIGTTETISLDGLKGISTDQWYRNIVMHDLRYNTEDLLDYAPTLAKQVSGILPVNSLFEDKYQRIEGIDKLLVKDFEDIISKTIERARSRHPQIDIESILSEIPDIDKQMLSIAYLKEGQINLIELENYLKNKFEQDNDILKNSKPSTRTNLRRLIRIYDYLKGESKKASDLNWFKSQGQKVDSPC